MAWPFSAVAQPTVDTGLVLDLPTALTDVPGVNQALTCILNYVWIDNSLGPQRTVSLSDAAGVIFGHFQVAGGFSGFVGDDVFRKQQTGLRWKIDVALATLGVQIVAWQ
jgi:hypothetical protein